MKDGQRAFLLIEVALMVSVAIIIFTLSVIVIKIVTTYTRNEHNQAFKSVYIRLKKSFNDAQLENGPVTSWNYGKGQTPDNFAKTYLVPYFSIKKDCATNPKEGCFAKNKFYKRLDGSLSAGALDNLDGYKILLTTGESLYFKYNPYCVQKRQRCIDIYVDTNGPDKGPSKYGRDLFLFYVYPFTNEIKPFGTYSNDKTRAFKTSLKCWLPYPYISDCHSKGWGTTCGAKIMSDGFEMNY